ncbi:hypothetical protein [Streptomyces sp. WP-1]|uniref:hypothetical protein n=1 Tax=Streptomyces sp. WP-1 TaxID=3041497 RepID=UPI0026490C68|nr:hypothetical protein [Streptomyces sp. WP-1]WKE71446.1 hypothetical protein QHG49_21710 [Streptomyces sp. WP-1]
MRGPTGARPLWTQLRDAPRDHGPATASRPAERLGESSLGESSGATSYHMRRP